MLPHSSRPFLSPAPAILLALSMLAAGCARTDDALRDAWALWLDHEPTCLELLERDPAELSARWRLALEALSAETLRLMEERLARSRARGESRRLLGELVAGSRRICELARGRPVAALASTVAVARADVAWTRSRLAVILPLGAGEARRRAARYDRRLSRAVSEALDQAGAGSDARPGDRTSAPATEATAASPSTAPPSAAPEPLAPSAPSGPSGPSGRSGRSGRSGIDGAAAARSETKEGPRGSSAQTGAATGAISIRPVSGEAWPEVRRRREAEAARRLAVWYPLYRRGLRPLGELRAELAVGLERESLEGLAGLCVRLGRAAERVPPETVARAPATGLAAELTALLEAYADAGRACAAGRPVQAWGRLAAGDRSWSAVRQQLELLADGPPVPESLLRAARGHPAPGATGVE